MKIFCNDHGQPLDLDQTRGEYTCKITGCLVAISTAGAAILEGSLRSIRVVEVWLAPK